MKLGTVHFLRGRGAGHRKKNGFEGGAILKKIREKGGHVKYYLYWRGGRGKKFSYWGWVMQLSNDTSKNSTRPPYLVKNERSLIGLQIG